MLLVSNQIHRRSYQRDRSAPDGPSPSRSPARHAAPDWMSDAPRPCPASRIAPGRGPPAAISPVSSAERPSAPSSRTLSQNRAPPLRLPRPVPDPYVPRPAIPDKQ